ncbi:Cytochrome c-type biogenesis protein CcmE heme chaperone [Paramagnetospirillum magnetotacticum MS-1]|uniref:Cytochrome c-type biogenesis protein CcmE n=1 Tax=Paramagnetospirillum magnetotacticum MS-1 TaxID=272627 RepID=A0A0C2YTZ0_PARME|nr:cytochrome c maturation protein CcmE [Paramagnetospirillum magnetotacticum]KIL98160.1 Cytochrome c-type biogenesis protein CcmE heme chaperone [Paramagnetospirillum magnetotacticum MS-1]
MTRKQRRLYFVLLGMLALGGAVALVLTAISDSLVYFYSPTDIVGQRIPEGRRMRIGGLVENDSVIKDGKTVTFKITDVTNTVPVVYTGVLPDLFREGQGVVVEGRMEAAGHFKASEVLAKHDENYMPKEVAEALKKSGQWNDGKKK